MIVTKFIVKYQAHFYETNLNHTDYRGNISSEKGFDSYDEAIKWVSSGYKKESLQMDGFIQSIDDNIYLRTTTELIVDESILRDIKIDKILK